MGGNAGVFLNSLAHVFFNDLLKIFEEGEDDFRVRPVDIAYATYLSILASC